MQSFVDDDYNENTLTRDIGHTKRIKTIIW